MITNKYEGSLVAYDGDLPYIFVSYAHKDTSKVMPYLMTLANEGYRVWFDEGIHPGNEWPHEIEQALIGAAQFVVFISNNSVKSVNCRNEINFALNRNKPFLALYLEKTELKHGLGLRMGDIQAVFLKKFSSNQLLRKIELTFSYDLKDPNAQPQLKAIKIKSKKRKLMIAFSLLSLAIFTLLLFKFITLPSLPTDGDFQRITEHIKAVPEVADKEGIDNFGCQIKANNEFIAVSASRDEEAGYCAGAVHLFDVDSQDYLSTLRPKDLEPGDFFGSSIAISENFLAANALSRDGDAINTGCIYVFSLPSLEMKLKLELTQGVKGEEFGSKIAIFGETLIVGMENSNKSGQNSGRAFLYSLKNGELISELFADGIQKASRFGSSVTINEKYACVGTPGNSRVSVFDSATGRHLTDIDFEPNSFFDNRFGSSISLQNNLLAISLDRRNRNLDFQVHIYDLNRNNILVSEISNKGFWGTLKEIQLSEDYLLITWTELADRRCKFSLCDLDFKEDTKELSIEDLHFYDYPSSAHIHNRKAYIGVTVPVREIGDSKGYFCIYDL